MKRNVIIMMCAATIAAMALSSCKDDDKDEIWYNTLGDVENPAGNSAFVINSDRGNTVYFSQTAYPAYKPEDGKRIIATFTMVNSNPSGYDAEGRLIGYYEVLTKDVVGADEDDLGDDATYLEDIWIRNGYINIEFNTWGYNKTHYINLARMEEQFTDGKTHLRFCHNAYNDTPNSLRWGLVSFRVSSVWPSPDDATDIVIHYKEYGLEAEQTITLKYTEDSSERHFAPESEASIM